MYILMVERLLCARLWLWALLSPVLVFALGACTNAEPEAKSLGSYSPAVELSNPPDATTSSTSFTFNVSSSTGAAVGYKFKTATPADTVNCYDPSGYTASAADLSTAISLTGLADGTHRLCLIGVDSLGLQQPYHKATVVNWTVNTTTDITPPTVTLSTTSTTVTGTFSVTATFSEAVTGFVNGDITTAVGGDATGATISNFSGSGDTYTFDVTPSGGVGTVTLSVAAGVAQDGASNLNTASNNLIVNFSPPLTGFDVTGISTPHPAGTAQTVTVRALTAGNYTKTDYVGTVTFSSSDGGAVLPANYTFVASDSGQHTFTSGVNFRMAGTQWLRATDTNSGTIYGEQTGITVTHAAAAALAFSTQPADANVNTALTPVVRIHDAYGNLVTSGSQATQNVTLSVVTGPDSTLNGTYTLAASGGVATWTGTQNLTIDVPGTYTLQAAISSPSSITVSSSLFVISTTAPAYTWTGAGGDGLWSNAANWSTNAKPTSANVAIFNSSCASGPACNVTINEAVNVAGINIENTYTGIITQGVYVVTVGANGWTQAGGTWVGSASGGGDQLEIAGNFSLTSGTFHHGHTAHFRGTSFSHTGGTLDYIDSNNGLWVFDGASTVNISSAGGLFRYIRIAKTASSAHVTVSGTLSVGWLQIGSTAAHQLNGGTIEITAEGISGSSGCFLGGGSATVRFTGSSAQSIDTNSDSDIVLPHIEINKSGNTLSLMGTITVAGDWTHTSGTLTAGTSAVRFVGANSTTLTSGGGSFNDITVAKDSGAQLSLPSSAPGDLNVSGALTLNSGALDMNGRNVTTNTLATAAGTTIYQDCGTLTYTTYSSALGTIYQGLQGLSLSVADADPVSEGSPLNFTVSISPQVNCVATTFTYATSDGTAIAPGDYTATSGTAGTYGTIPANSSSVDIPAPTIEDGVYENASENLTLTISAPSDAVTITDPSATGTISADSGSAPTVAITSPTGGTWVNNSNVNSFAISGTCNHNGRSVAVTVSGSPLGTVDKGSTTCDGTNWSLTGVDLSGFDDDADSTPDNLTIAATFYGVSATSVSIGKDTTLPGTPTISGVAGGTDSLSNDFLLTDETAQPHIYWSAASGASNYDVAVKSADASTVICFVSDVGNVTDYQFGASACALTEGQTYMVFVTAKDAAGHIAAGAEQIFLPPAIYIENAGAVPEGTTSTFNVYLSSVSARDVVFNWATSDGSATASSDYTAASGTGVTLTANTNYTNAAGTPYVITVATADDSIDEESTETFTVTLSDFLTSAKTGSAGTMPIATNGEIQDNDAIPTLSIDSPTAVTEGNNITFTVTLSAVSGRDVTVDYAITAGTATDNAATNGSTVGDYSASSPAALTGTLTFTAGSATTQTITVATLADGRGEDDETFTVTLSNGQTGTPSETVTITTAIGTGTISAHNTAPTFDTQNLSDLAATVGQAYSHTFAVTDSVDTHDTGFAWSVDASNTCSWAGTALNTSDGTVTFTPTAEHAGSCNLALTVTDSNGPTQTATQSFSFFISYPPVSLALDAAAVTGDQLGFSSAASGDFVIAGAPYRDTAGADVGAAVIYHFNGTTSAWSEHQVLTPGSSIDNSLFGSSVDISGAKAIVGAPEDADGGSVYIFTYNDTAWDSGTKLSISGTSGDLFGASVAIDGDVAVVGAPNRNEVYVYRYNGSTWDLEQTISSATVSGTLGDLLGFSVDISGDTVVIGAIQANSDTGAAYVFRYDPTAGPGAQWELQDTLTGFAVDDDFGHSVSVSTDRLVIGAKLRDGTYADAGAAYVYHYEYDGTTNYSWNLKNTLMADSVSAIGHNFGSSVAISHDTLVVGASGANGSQGKAYFYHFNGSAWVEKSILVNSSGAANDLFGASVGITGDRIVVGAPGRMTNGQSTAGALFVREVNPKPSMARVTADSDVSANAYLGASVAIDGDTAAVGAYGESSNAGAVYIFKYANGVWTRQARITSPEASVRFGSAVALSGHTLVVGSSSSPGQAWIYEYTGSSWALKATLTPPDPGTAGDANFGKTVAISGKNIVIGAPSAGLNAGCTSCGAAYVYRFDEGTSPPSWSHSQTLFATDIAPDIRETGDFFGASVAISKDTLIVGATADEAIGNSGGNTGAAIIYRFNGASWVAENTKLVGTGASSNSNFGYSVALDGNIAIIGAPTFSGNDGKAFIYQFNGTSWVETPLDPTTNLDKFGISVSISGHTAIVGANLAAVGGNASAGSAYIYDYNGSSWTQRSWGDPTQNILTAGADVAASQQFGLGVCLSGDTAIIGAPVATINSTSGAGAAHFFDLRKSAP